MFPNQFRWISSASIEIMYKFLEISISKFLNMEKKDLYESNFGSKRISTRKEAYMLTLQ